MPALQEATEEARTARIRLRRLSLEDVADVHRLRERPDVMKYTYATWVPAHLRPQC